MGLVVLLIAKLKQLKLFNPSFPTGFACVSNTNKTLCIRHSMHSRLLGLFIPFVVVILMVFFLACVGFVPVAFNMVLTIIIMIFIFHFYTMTVGCCQMIMPPSSPWCHTAATRNKICNVFNNSHLPQSTKTTTKQIERERKAVNRTVTFDFI